MRSMLSGLVMAAGLMVAVQAPARGLVIDGDHCGFQSDYDLTVADDGLHFKQAGGRPATLWMHDGQLQADGQQVRLGGADAQRLRQYEAQVRALLPQVAQIARDGVDIGFSALTTVVATFADSGQERAELMDKLKRQHADALRQVDEGIGEGHWSHQQMGDLVEDSIGAAIGELVGTVSASAVKAALSGDEGRMAALQARADSLDQSIDREVDKRADKLGERAQALCPRIAALDQLQQSFDFRLGDGSRLRLLSHVDAEVAKRR